MLYCALLCVWHVEDYIENIVTVRDSAELSVCG